MLAQKVEKDLKTLVEQLDSVDSNKAWGEIVCQLIISNIRTSENMENLIKSMDISSVETTKINRRIMYLTIAVALSAVIAIIRDILAIIG